MSATYSLFRPRSMSTLATRWSTNVRAECQSTTSHAIHGAPTEYHTPVMGREVVDVLASVGEGVVIDATLGGGGHSALLLAANPHLRVLGIDRDPDARAQATKVLAPFAGRFLICSATFADIAEVVADSASWINGAPIVGVLMDLGVSSFQLDNGERGFSFRADAPLDMRMDQTTGLTAAEYIATADLDAFTALLRANGKDRFAFAIAKSVLASRPQTTNELSSAVERVVPMAARRKGHVATRVFQALRIAVNDEMVQLERGLTGALQVLSPNGVLYVISYHSGEDRMVKSTFHHWATGGCTCPHELGCVCGAVPSATVDRASAQLASDAEISQNPRARSARVRIARKVAS